MSLEWEFRGERGWREQVLGDVPRRLGWLEDSFEDFQREAVHVPGRSRPVSTPRGLAAESTILLTDAGETVAFLDVTWDEQNVVRVAEVQVRYKDANASDWMYLSVPAGETGVRIGPVAADEGYQVGVRAVSPGGTPSPWSVTVSAVTAADRKAPDAPVGLQVSPGLRSLNLSWHNPGDADFDHVEVWFSPIGSRSAGLPMLVATPRGEYYAFDPTVPLPGGRPALWPGVGLTGLYERYYFWIRAVDRTGNASGWTPATDEGVAATPTRVVASDVVSRSITADRLAAGTITASEIAASTITANEIAASAITTQHISSSAIVTDLLAASAVTAGQISVSELAAISASMGLLTAGSIRGVSGSFGGGELLLDENGMVLTASQVLTKNAIIWKGQAETEGGRIYAYVNPVSANHYLYLQGTKSASQANKSAEVILTACHGDNYAQFVIKQRDGATEHWAYLNPMTVGLGLGISSQPEELLHVAGNIKIDSGSLYCDGDVDFIGSGSVRGAWTASGAVTAASGIVTAASIAELSASVGTIGAAEVEFGSSGIHILEGTNAQNEVRWNWSGSRAGAIYTRAVEASCRMEFTALSLWPTIYPGTGSGRGVARSVLTANVGGFLQTYLDLRATEKTGATYAFLGPEDVRLKIGGYITACPTEALEISQGNLKITSGSLNVSGNVDLGGSGSIRGAWTASGNVATACAIALGARSSSPPGAADGWLAYADGSGWDPGGSGAGFYGYVAGAWAKL